MYEFDFNSMIEFLPEILAGALVTLRLTALALMAGAVLGLGLALAKISRLRILSWMAYGYIEFFRTTPLLVQIIWVYFVGPVVTGYEIDSFQAAALALGLNMAAFMAEIFRAGIQGVDAAQRDAGRVLGLTRVDAFRYIVLPQALRIVFPPITTTIILLLKGTSLASAIGVLELLRVGQLIASETFRPVEALTTVAIFYFILAYPVALGARYLEKRLRIGQE